MNEQVWGQLEFKKTVCQNCFGIKQVDSNICTHCKGKSWIAIDDGEFRENMINYLVREKDTGSKKFETDWS